MAWVFPKATNGGNSCNCRVLPCSFLTCLQRAKVANGKNHWKLVSPRNKIRSDENARDSMSTANCNGVFRTNECNSVAVNVSLLLQAPLTLLCLLIVKQACTREHFPEVLTCTHHKTYGLCQFRDSIQSHSRHDLSSNVVSQKSAPDFFFEWKLKHHRSHKISVAWSFLVWYTLVRISHHCCMISFAARTPEL